MRRMKVVKVSLNNLNKVVNAAVSALQKGKILICPTDTVYGLVADATNPKAVKEIFLIKKRSTKKPLGVFIISIAAAKKFAEINKAQEKFLKKVWPGKVTVVLKSKNTLPKSLGASKTIGIRIPKYPFLSSVLQKFNGPLAQTSVNISGEPPLNNVQSIVRLFQNKKYKPDIIFNAGALPKSLPSAVIDLTKPKKKILRKGAFK